MSLASFLSQKPLYYDKIDYSRFPRAWAAVKNEPVFADLPFIIHIIGTNGKGSTGRYLAQILRSQNKRVFHYTSPHLFSFNERFWLDGKNASDSELEAAHNKLINIFSAGKDGEKFIETLSYFEWATLIAAVLANGFDEVIFEAGMGGEYDATNAFSKKLSVFTNIALDHTAMLGDTTAKIAKTKLNAMAKTAILPAGFSELELAKSIATQKAADLFIANSVATLASNSQNLPSFLMQNLNLAAHAASYVLGGIFDSELIKNINKNPPKLDLAGRFERIAPNIIIDVGHNAHAANAVINAISGDGDSKKYSLIFNAFSDKDIEPILFEFKECLKEILIYSYPSLQRSLATNSVKDAAARLQIRCKELCDLSQLDSAQSYLVFGSFLLVEHFINEYKRANIER